MVYVKKVKIKGNSYWYLFHTIRHGNKFLKKSKYLGRDLPKNLEKIKKQFLAEITEPKKEKTEDQLLLESLTPLERKVFPALKEENEVNKLANKLKFKKVEIIRALGWLENKHLLKLIKKEKEVINLDTNGLTYIKIGLPEKQLLKLLPATLEQLKQHLKEEEINIAAGTLKRRSAILMGKEIKITNKGKEFLKEKSEEEIFLKNLPLEISKLSKEQNEIYNKLKLRKKIIKTEARKIITADLTNLGEDLIKRKLKTNLIEALSSDMLTKGTWKGKTFRRFDIKSSIPKIYPGRRHFVNEAINYIRKIWTDLGFREMYGNLVQTSFWNFDALFQPQDHPARDLQDTFFIKRPKYGSLPNKEIVKAVKKAHEIGISNSKGWQYKWSKEEARKNILRTHNTVLSARTLANLDLKNLPQKFFAVGKCFRNESLDWKHLFELTQVEGIVVDENANFKHLIGYLKEFFSKMGYEKVRVRPAFFPYTSCSAEVEVFHPVKEQWIELGGSGIFRPEVTVPLLGKDIPVLAWGLGLERTIVEYYNINDLRLLYKNDLKQLREIKLWLK